MSAILATRSVEKPWGRQALPPPFSSPRGERIGEVWFEPPAQLPDLLIKYIFTSEKLSVQVHPSDEQTEAAGLGRQGKEECWLVIDAEPDAQLGIGFKADVDATTLRKAAIDGEIENMLAWHAVRPGDFFYVPANTVHAIGAGISLIEIQQNSDITYRLYDYGRPRELHLDEAVAVASRTVYDLSLHKAVPQRGTVSLVNGPPFRLDQINGLIGPRLAAKYRGPVLVVPRSGQANIAGTVIKPGQCGLASDLSSVKPEKDSVCLIAQSHLPM